MSCARLIFYTLHSRTNKKTMTTKNVAFFLESIETDEILAVGDTVIDTPSTASTLPLIDARFFIAGNEDCEQLLCLTIDDMQADTFLFVKRTDMSTYKADPQEFTGGRPPRRPI
jgi:hypothetical protein